MHHDFEERHVVVTGATGALGGAVLSRLLEAGAHCHVPAIEKEPQGLLPAHERLSFTPELDLADEQAVRGFYGELPGLWASLHIAGGFGMSAIADTALEHFEAMLRINAKSAFLCCREAVRTMRAKGPKKPGREGLGRIVNVAAQTALDGRRGAGMTAYAMAKAAVGSLTVALGEELAGEAIWVNAVAPSIIDTPANREGMPDAPHEKWAGVDEIAETVLYLASPSNRAARSGIVPVYGRS